MRVEEKPWLFPPVSPPSSELRKLYQGSRMGSRRESQKSERRYHEEAVHQSHHRNCAIEGPLPVSPHALPLLRHQNMREEAISYPRTMSISSPYDQEIHLVTPPRTVKNKVQCWGMIFHLVESSSNEDPREQATDEEMSVDKGMPAFPELDFPSVRVDQRVHEDVESCGSAQISMAKPGGYGQRTTRDTAQYDYDHTHRNVEPETDQQRSGRDEDCSILSVASVKGNCTPKGTRFEPRTRGNNDSEHLHDVEKLDGFSESVDETENFHVVEQLDAFSESVDETRAQNMGQADSFDTSSLETTLSQTFIHCASWDSADKGITGAISD